MTYHPNLLLILALAAPVPAQTVPAGVPLRVALEHRVAIRRVGEPIQGRLAEPVYIFDRMALPAGSLVQGHIAEISGVPARQRFMAILAGNFAPPREVRAQFDTLVLSDGSRLPLHTSFSRGTAYPVRITAAGKKQEDRAALRAFKGPGKMTQLKNALFGMLPYRRQAWPAGTLFNPVLQYPVSAPAPSQAEPQTANAAIAAPGPQEVSARLLAPISSATARKGAPVEAVVTRPLFSASHDLLIPEGTHILGDIVEAQPARSFHRNGKLLLAFRQIQLPAGGVQSVQGYVDGMEVSFDAHLALDSEGSMRVSSPKTRFIFPAIAVAVAGLSLHQDYNAQGVPDQDLGGRAESGAVGLGLVGTLLAQTSHSLASGIAFSGAAFSVYSTFIARGVNVGLPANTPIQISLGARRGEAGGSGERRDLPSTAPPSGL